MFDITGHNVEHGRYRFALNTTNVCCSGYAKQVGNLMACGHGSWETGRATYWNQGARQFPVIFEGPEKDSDTFEITMPPVMRWMTCSAVDVDYACQLSQQDEARKCTEVRETFEIKELSVPLDKMDDLKNSIGSLRVTNGIRRS